MMRLNKLVVAMIKVAAIYGLTSLSSTVTAETGGQAKGGATINWDGVKNVQSIPTVPGKEIATKAVPGAALGVYALDEGRTVPAQRLDGRAAKKAATGAIIYGRGVYVTHDGIVRSSGKVVRKLGPGESLSMDELEGFSLKGPDSPSAAQGVYELDDGRTVPAQRLDGSASRKTATGDVMFGRSVYVTRDGIVHSSGKVVRKLGPGESLSMDELEGFSRKGPDAPSGSAGTASSTPPVGRSDIPGSPTGYPASPNEAGPANVGLGNPSGAGGSAISPGAIASPDRATGGESRTGQDVFILGSGTQVPANTGSQQAFPSTTSDGGLVYVMTNGQTVPRTGPDGEVGKPNENGGVDYDGGLSINPTESGRSVVTGSPNGSYISVEKSTDASGNATFDLGNGTSVPANGRAGQGHIAAGGEGVEYSDGTFISVDGKTGDTVVQYPNGSSEVMQGQNNRKDAANYVYTTSGESSGSGSSNNPGSKKDSDDNSAYTGNKDTRSDDNEGSKNQDDDEDSSDDGSDGSDGSDDKGDDSGSKDGGKDSDDKEGADKNLGAEGDAGNAPAGKKTVDDALARKTGDKKQPDSTAPPGCDEGRGGPPGGVAEPGAGRQDCVPGSLQPKGEEDDEATPAPVLNTPIGNTFKRDAIKPEDRVGQPGVGIDRNSNDGRTLENKLQDIEGVVNPGDR